jgi:hypothetical protein
MAPTMKESGFKPHMELQDKEYINKELQIIS